MITSSALVASSAISSAGRCMTAIAIKTRCACPTLICEGYFSKKSSDEGRLTLSSAERMASSQVRSGSGCMGIPRFFQLLSDLERRIQRRLRTLQYQRDLAASQAAQIAFTAEQKVTPFEFDRSLDLNALAIEQS